MLFNGGSGLQEDRYKYVAVRLWAFASVGSLVWAAVDERLVDWVLFALVAAGEAGVIYFAPNSFQLWDSTVFSLAALFHICVECVARLAALAWMVSPMAAALLALAAMGIAAWRTKATPVQAGLLAFLVLSALFVAPAVNAVLEVYVPSITVIVAFGDRTSRKLLFGRCMCALCILVFIH